MNKITSAKLKAGIRFYIPTTTPPLRIYEVMYDWGLRRFIVYCNGELVIAEQKLMYLKMALSVIQLDFINMHDKLGAL